MNKTVIVSYARTPFGKFLGSLSHVPAVDLGALVIREAVKRAGINSSEIDNVIMGVVVSAGMGQVSSRQASIKAGLPDDVPSETINKVCASSLRAVNLADVMIKAGEAEIMVVGGMENMSLCPHLIPKSRTGYRIGHGKLIDSMIVDGLWCPFHNKHMGEHGEIPNIEFDIKRHEMDEWAYRSHDLAIKAMSEGRFNEEIIPVDVSTKKEPNKILVADESPRSDTTIEKLGKLPAAFKENGTVTAGNAPPISDGATALVLMSMEKAEELGIKPLASIVSQGMASREAAYISTVPYYAAEKALVKAKLKISDIDLIEVNEAFASVSLTSIKLGGWDKEKVNVNGGAIALGHPIGASGGRLLMTLVSELRRSKGRYGLATICSGAGQGEATIIKAI